MKEIDHKVSELLKIMDDLRLKCPWDKKQSFDSLKRLTIEETYELVNAIEKKDYENIKEELGDLLLHIVFYSKISSENKFFDFNDVVNLLIKKLIDRHPHIYGNIGKVNEKEVILNWERIKQENNNLNLLSGVPENMPPITKAYRVQEKVSGVGFGWDRIDGVLEKVKEEIIELTLALESKNKKDIEEEFGDLLFSLINYSRFIDIDPETSLNNSTNKFINRFNNLENLVKNQNKKISNLSSEEMNKYWEEVKQTNF
jgi:XTP/dITP diphosphohydrolase|tara:strand:- start:14007 stop:14777 length:771 start_codon:yes stop_codon:yes gene_type:complete